MARRLLVSLLALMVARLAVSDHSMPGSLRNISVDDNHLQEAVLAGVYAYNNRSNDAFLFKTSAVLEAQRQIVNGIRYVIESEISRTVCRKGEVNNDPSKCDFQPKGQLHQAFRCHFDVLAVPWKKVMKTLSFLCKS